MAYYLVRPKGALGSTSLTGGVLVYSSVVPSAGAPLSVPGLASGEHEVYRLSDEPLLVTVANTAPVVSGSAALSILENTTAVATFTADETVTWSLTGADAARFAITAGPSTSGVLTLVAGLNFEAPTDVGANNVYDVTVVGTDAGALTGSRAVAVTITDVAEAPDAFASAGWTLVDAPSAGGDSLTLTIGTLPATNGGALTRLQYRLGTGAAVDLTGLGTGARTITVPAGAAASVSVRAVNAAGDGVWSAAKTATPSNVAAVLSGPTTASILENTTAVTTFSANEAVTWSLTGADAALFTIPTGPALTAALAFAAGRNFEAPGDAGANNVYDVSVSATDSGGAVTTRSIAVTVTDVAEAPDAIADAGWSLVDSPSTGGDKLSLSILSLPATNGGALTKLQYRIGSAAAVDLTGLGTGARTITVLAGAAASIQVRAVNAAGDGPWATAKAATPTVASAITRTLAQVENVRVLAKAALAAPKPTKVPGVDALPTGITYTSSTKLVTVLASADVVLWEGWNLTGMTLQFNAGGIIQTMRNIWIEAIEGSDQIRLLDGYPSAAGGVRVMEDCIFIGAGEKGLRNAQLKLPLSALIVGRISGTGADAIGFRIDVMRRCYFFGSSSDGIKDTAIGRREDCYFDAPVNVHVKPELYDATRTYAVGDVVDGNGPNVSGYHQLLVASTGVAPPTTATSTTTHQYVDPHADQGNPYAAIGAAGTMGEYVGCYFCRDDAHRLWRPGEGYGWGMNNSYRGDRNSGTDYLFRGYNIHHNIVAGGADLQSAPVAPGAAAGQGNWSPSRIRDNWITKNSGGVQIYEEATAIANGHDIGNNADYVVPAFGPSEVAIAWLSRSNDEHGLITLFSDTYNIEALTKPVIRDQTLMRYYGQNGDFSGFVDLAVTNANASEATAANNRVLNAGLLAAAALWESTVPTVKGYFADLALAGRELSAALRDDETVDGQTDWKWTDLTTVRDMVPKAIDLVLRKFAGSVTKREYLRLANTAAPAAAVALDTSLAHTVFDANQVGTAIPANALFSITDTKLSIRPEGGTANVKAMFELQEDADWAKVLLMGDKTGRMETWGATGGHPYSNIASGQILMAHTQWWPHILYWLYTNDAITTEPVAPGQQQFVVEGPGRAYADVYLRIPDELGTDAGMYTPRETWGIAASGTPFEDMQDLNLLFIQRAGEAGTAASPVWRVGSSGPVSHQGTVTRQSRRVQVALATLPDGTTVENGWWAVLRLTPQQAFADGDRIHVAPDETWAWTCKGAVGSVWPGSASSVPPYARNDGGTEAQGPVQQPALDIPKIRPSAASGLYRAADTYPFVGFDFMRGHPSHRLGGPQASVIDFTVSGTRSGGGSSSAITNGWQWNTPTSTAKTFYWIKADLIAGVPYRLTGTIEASLVSSPISFKAASNTALSADVQANRLITPAAAGVAEPIDQIFTPQASTDYIGFLVTGTGQPVVKLTNLKLVEA